MLHLELTIIDQFSCLDNHSKIIILSFYCFPVVMHKSKEENGIGNSVHPHDSYRTREIGSFETGPLDGEMFLQVIMIH